MAQSLEADTNASEILHRACELIERVCSLRSRVLPVFAALTVPGPGHSL